MDAVVYKILRDVQKDPGFKGLSSETRDNINSVVATIKSPVAPIASPEPSEATEEADAGPDTPVDPAESEKAADEPSADDRQMPPISPEEDAAMELLDGTGLSVSSYSGKMGISREEAEKILEPILKKYKDFTKVGKKNRIYWNHDALTKKAAAAKKEG